MTLRESEVSSWPRWLSVSEAAAYLCMTTDAFRRLVRSKRLPAPSRSLGDRWPRWDREGLDAVMLGTTAAPALQAAAEVVEVAA